MGENNECPQCGAKLSSWAFDGEAKRWECGSHEHKGVGQFTGRGCFRRRIDQLRAEIERLQTIVDSMGPWAAAGLDDPSICTELKLIFGAIVLAARDNK